MKHTEIGRNERCPCESGRKYKNCCHGKDFKWIRNEDGEIFRSVPLSQEAVDVLEEAKDAFRRVLGREPHDHDPIHIGQYLYSDSDFEREMLAAMGRAGTDPALVYAYRKTGGLMITEDNKRLAPQKDIDAWNNAIDEYYRANGKPEKRSTADRVWDRLGSELDHVIILFGYLLEHGGQEDYSHSKCASKVINYETYVMVAATRSFRTLKSIRYLLEKDIGEDCLSLTRSIYESYIRIAYAKSNPDNLRDMVDAVVGLKLGTHEFSTDKKGRKIIVHVVTGEEYKAHISNFRMSEGSLIPIDKDLFTGIYEFLSECAHPTSATLPRLFDEDFKLAPLANELQHEALFYSLYFACLVLDEVRLLPSINDSVAADIRNVLARITEQLAAVIDGFLSKNSETKILSERLALVGTSERKHPRRDGTTHNAPVSS